MADKLLAEWFWTDRWMGSSAFGLPMEARGLYREMLTQAWRRGAQLPSDPETIQRLTGCTEAEWKRCWPSVRRYWTVDGDRIYNETQREVYAVTAERVQSYSDRGKRAAAARWGNAQADAQAKPKECPPSPEPDPSPDQTPEPKNKGRRSAADVGSVLAHYQSFHPRSRPGEKERKMVAARLKEGYTVADLQAAIDGNHRSLFHCGDNDRGQKYHAVHLIFRSSDHVRQFMEIPSNGQVVAPANVKNIGALNAWLENER